MIYIKMYVINYNNNDLYKDYVGNISYLLDTKLKIQDE